MKLDKALEPFRAAIESVQRLLHKSNDRGVIVGGIAVGFLGRPRFTADVAAVFLLSTKDISQFVKLAQAEDIFPRIREAEDLAREYRVLFCATILQKQTLTFL